MNTKRKPSKINFHYWRGYLLAIVLVALATWLKYLAQPNVIPANVPILYLLAIVPTAIFFGFGPAILVCILSVLSFDFFFIPPLYQISWDIIEAPILAIFFAVGILFSYLASNLRRKNLTALQEITARKQSEAELVKYKNHLEDLVQQRTSELETANTGLKQEIVVRKQTEEALRESEQRWATTLGSIGDAVIATDVRGNITFMNPVAEALTGWRTSEASTQPITQVFDIINEHSRQKVDNPVEKVLQQGTVCGLANHTLLMRKDGTPIAIDDSGAPIKTTSGETIGVVLIFRDITERKKSEQALRESEERFKAIADSTPDHILVQDASLRYTFVVNPQIGLTEKDMLGKTDYNILDKEDAEKLTQIKRQVIATGKPYHLETSLVNKEGKLEYFSGSYVPKLNRDGQIEGLIGYFQNVTERKKAEEQLKQYATNLETANKELEAFSYSVSHDLRAPLRVLDGFSEMILTDYEDKLDETLKGYLNRIRKASKTMSELIDAILKLSRISRAEIHLEKVDLTDLSRSIAEGLKQVQPERQVEFVFEPDLIVKGDIALLRVALNNLLENAWKYTGKCPVARIEVGSLIQNGERVYFVKDNGVGFDMRYKDKLFQPFQRLHTGNEYSGTGIGLATVQRVIRRHNGHIRAESEVSKGTTFYFTLG